MIMAGMKNYYDQILENQKGLFNTMTDYNKAVMEMMMPDKAATQKAGELMNEYWTRYFTMMEKMATKEHLEAYQKDFWGSFNADYTKNMELTMEVYKKSMDYFRGLWSKNIVETQQQRVQKITELYQETVKAAYDANTANAKVVEHYFE
jgi:hypothetical protein